MEAARNSRRAELFALFAEQAIARQEIADGLTLASTIDADYLRTKCINSEASLWGSVVESASAFDAAADQHDGISKKRTISSLMHRLCTSLVVQREFALAGIGVCILSFFTSTQGNLLPNLYLLYLALLLAVIDLLLPAASLIARRVATRRATVRIGGPYLDAIGHAVPAFLLLAAITSVAQAPIVNGVKSTSGANNSVLLGVLVTGMAFAFSFRRYTLIGSRESGRLRFAAIRPPMVFGLTVIPLLIALARNNDNSRYVTIVEPDFAFLSFGLALIAVGSVLAIAGGQSQPAKVVAREFKNARHRVEVEIIETAILPLLRTEINNNSQSYEVEIRIDGASGLSELTDPMYKVSTNSSKRVAALLNLMPGGSIGLAGPRGCGKTTLMESYCGSKRTDSSSVATMVSAPVEYSPREFLLHLYSKVCREVLGPDADIALGLDPLSRRNRRKDAMAMLSGSFILSAVGVFLLVAPGAGLEFSTSQLWGLASLVIGFLLVLHVSRSSTPSKQNGHATASLANLASDRLEEIRFQQAFTTTWAGSLKAPVGIESTLGGGRSLTRQQMHLPEIVDSLRSFLEVAASEHRLIIGIDELDKMPSERAAEQFLNDIKGIFGVRGCYFMVSVSEDAMAGFERRGMPFRDVFDSAFDEIVWFSPLAESEAIAAIDRRVVRMPVPFKKLCHALAGGLPRDLIRVARATVNAQSRQSHSPDGEQVVATNLNEIVRRLLAKDVDRKTHAVAVAARRISLEPDVSRFLVACEGMRHANVSPTSLQSRILEISQIDAPRFREDPNAEPALALLYLMCELACYYYYSATISEFFDSAASCDRWHLATLGSESPSVDLGLLVKARHSFSLNVTVAWRHISAFRESCGLSVEQFPASLEID